MSVPESNSTFNPGRVLVTGGASGLGAATVARVLDAGGTPVVLDRDIFPASSCEPSAVAQVETAIESGNAAPR